MYVMVVKDKEAFDLYACEYAKANGVTDRKDFWRVLIRKQEFCWKEKTP